MLFKIDYETIIQITLEIFYTVAIRKGSGEPLIINQEGLVATEAAEGVPIKVSRHDPHSLSMVEADMAADVEALDPAVRMPLNRLKEMLTGPVEYFRHGIGFTDKDTKPTKLTAALWLEYREGSPRLHEFILEGNHLDISFLMSKLFGKDGLPIGSDVNVAVREDPSNIRFRPGSNVTDWNILSNRFQGSMSTPGSSITWSEGNPIYSR